MTIELIINSDEKSEIDQLKHAVKELRRRSHDVEGRVTFEGKDSRRFAREATQRGVDLIIVAGGDGTVNKVVNGIFEASGEEVAGRRPRLGVVPLGTGNDFAGFLEIPAKISDAMDVAVEGSEIEVDVASLNGHRFVNVSSGGVGAEATEEASDRAKRLLGSVAYFVTGMKKFATLQPSQARFTSGDETLFDGDFLFFAVGNGARTGGGNFVTPRADLSDGLLDLCVVEAVNHADFLRLLPELRSGGHLRNGHVLYRQLAALTVQPNGDVSVNADGEPIEDRVFEYSIHPRALRLSVPRPRST